MVAPIVNVNIVITHVVVLVMPRTVLVRRHFLLECSNMLLLLVWVIKHVSLKVLVMIRSRFSTELLVHLQVTTSLRGDIVKIEVLVVSG